MAQRYFIDSNPLYRLVAGKQAEIYAVDNGNPMGLLVAESDAEAAKMLATTGVEEISQDQYEARLKKKATALPPPWPLKAPLPKPGAEAAITGKGDAIVVESGGSAGNGTDGKAASLEPETKELLDGLMGSVTNNDSDTGN